MEHLSTNYNPEDFENKWYDFWIKGKSFSASYSKTKIPYSILMPPPNITSQLHMGHALNNTIIDVLIRFYKMQGMNVLYQPGMDHAGIATQNVVEKYFHSRGRKREDFSKNDFQKTLWDWKDNYSARINDQLKALGLACDWDRERFTLDDGLSRAVRAFFVKLYEDGLVYRGRYIVNWCVRCGTAISNEEVEHRESNSFLYFVNYKIRGADDFICVATTRPETIFGDGALAFNPEDERYSCYVGKEVIVPILGRVIPLIEDKRVKKDFGTGVVKITAAHDANDFRIACDHGIESYVIMDKLARMTGQIPEKYIGLDRFECRDILLLDLEKNGFLVKVQDYKNQVSCCYRCDNVIEPYLSSQWFVRMKELAVPARDAAFNNKINFYPRKWLKTYIHWLDNIEDWCISRQIWWGHSIPVWNCLSCGNVMVLLEDPLSCNKCSGLNIKQDEDVLDTWFSSMLWPFSTLGWPDETVDLEYFYPSSVLVTAPEILFFWVSRMIIAGIYVRGDLPFKDIFLHSTIRDKFGRKMSKSLGNGIDPLDVIDEYGADALRFTLMRLAPFGEDIKLAFRKNSLGDGEAGANKRFDTSADNDFILGAKFANKVWNMSRFVIMNIDRFDLNDEYYSLKLDLADKWILYRLIELKAFLFDYFREYRFDLAVKSLYDFIWHDFCDFYLEISKGDLNSDSLGVQKKSAYLLIYLLKEIMRLLHPFMPFITQEIWDKVSGEGEKDILTSSLDIYNFDLIFDSDFYLGWFSRPLRNIFLDGKIQYKSFILWIRGEYCDLDDSIDYNQFKIVGDMNIISDFVRRIRNFRSGYDIKFNVNIDIVIDADSDDVVRLFSGYSHYISLLSGIGNIKYFSDYKGRERDVVITCAFYKCFICLDDVIDVDAEVAKLNLRISKLEKRLDTLNAMLTNDNFLKRAKKNIIENSRNEHDNIEIELDKLKADLGYFKKIT